MPPKEDEQQETSMRDDFDNAIAAIENDDEGAVTVETQADELEKPITAEDLNSDDGEKEAEAKAEEQVKAEADEGIKAAEVDDKPAGKDDDTVPDDKPAQSDKLDTAPISWNAAAREGWKDLTPEMQTHISKREREIEMSLNVGAAHRKTGEQFQAIADRYAQVFAAEGAPDAITGIEELIKTVTTLRMGSPAQKAQKVAGFIEHYGIDVETLDDILSGTIGGGKPAGDDPMAQLIDERMKPVDNLLARLDEQQRATQFQQNQDAINEVATFKQANEFYTDVQDDMADMVEMAAKRNVKMPLQDAYDKACAMNPQITEILTKRVNDERLINNGKTLEEKRQASSSISGKQGGAPSTSTEGLSMRETIEAALDAQVG